MERNLIPITARIIQRIEGYESGKVETERADRSAFDPKRRGEQ